MQNTENFDIFNFDSMVASTGLNPFVQEADKYASDDRFYNLTKKDGAGAALIRFIPDKNNHMIQKVQKINTTIVKNGKKRFVNEFSPSTIGKADPFFEKWQELWNKGDKEGSKVFNRGTRYIANIKVIKDPAKPENEGKIFLLEMSSAMNTKLEKALSPSQTDLDLGATAKQIFNPMKGNSFRLVAQKGANGQVNYDSSEIVNEVTSIYGSVQEALDDIKNNTYELSGFLKPEAYKSYDELKQKLNWVTFADASNVVNVAAAEVAPTQVVTPEVIATQPTQIVQPAVTQPTQVAPTSAQNDDLDSLLKDLVG